MNQILDYSPNKGNNNSSSGSDKVVHVFAIIIILFAVALIAGAGYNWWQRNKDLAVETPEEEKAHIEVVQEGAIANINVTHTKAIEKIIYSWNNDKETISNESGATSVSKEIKLPAGTNSLYVKIIDIDGNETSYENTFTSESGTDIMNPIIKLEVTETKKLKIVATDETSLDFITYRWNDGEETKVEAPEEDRTRIEVEIEILRGVNDLVISAVDSNNNTTLESKSFTGLTKPEITIVVAADKKKAEITVKHEKGLKSIALGLNGTEYPVDLRGENPPEIIFNTPQLIEGSNEIIVTAVSVDNTETKATEVVNNIVEEQPQEQGQEIFIEIKKYEEIPENAICSASHPSGIRELRVNINDMDCDLSGLPVGEHIKDTAFLLPLFDGNNRITFTVISMDGTEKQEVKEIVK